MTRKKIVKSVGALLLLAAIGFFCYDWYYISNLRENPKTELMYSWTDANGEKHFTNTYPLVGAKDIAEKEGVAYVRPTMATLVKNEAMEIFKKGQNLWNNYFGG
jgi:hypothetical protein